MCCTFDPQYPEADEDDQVESICRTFLGNADDQLATASSQVIGGARSFFFGLLTADFVHLFYHIPTIVASIAAMGWFAVSRAGKEMADAVN